MFRLSNLVTALFGIIAALGTILGIGSLGNANRTAQQPPEQLSPESDPTIATTPSNGTTGQTAPDSIAPSGARQVGQTATTPSDTAPATTLEAEAIAQNPSAEFIVQGEGAVLTTEPAPPATPSETTAMQLDPSPGVTVPTTVPTPAPVAQASESQAVPAPTATPVRAMW